MFSLLKSSSQQKFILRLYVWPVVLFAVISMTTSPIFLGKFHSEAVFEAFASPIPLSWILSDSTSFVTSVCHFYFLIEASSFKLSFNECSVVSVAKGLDSLDNLLEASS